MDRQSRIMEHTMHYIHMIRTAVACVVLVLGGCGGSGGGSAGADPSPSPVIVTQNPATDGITISGIATKGILEYIGIGCFFTNTSEIPANMVPRIGDILVTTQTDTGMFTPVASSCMIEIDLGMTKAAAVFVSFGALQL